MTIGNYVGAINQWLKLQEDHESFFMLVDLHAITVRKIQSNYVRAFLMVLRYGCMWYRSRKRRYLYNLKCWNAAKLGVKLLRANG